MTPRPRDQADFSLVRVAGMATTIPMLMVSGPLVGWFLGQWLGGLVSRPELGGLIGLAVGLATGVREAIRMTRRIIAELESKERRK